MCEPEFDLFGVPVDPATGKPGRPRKDATPEMRNKIKMLLAMGWSNERMASVVHMSLPTFRRVFFAELRQRDAMRDRLKATHFELLMKSAADGNVAAIKELGRVIAAQDMFDADRDLNRRQRNVLDDGAKAPEGKKQVAKAAALQVSESGWGGLLDPHRPIGKKVN